MSQGSMIGRMKGAAKVDVLTYEEVEHDRTATGQAAGVVAIVAVAQAIGGADAGLTRMLLAAVGALGGWLVWAGLTYLIGDKLFGGTASWGELLRTLGFAQTPGVFAVFAILPLVGWLVDAVVFLWILLASVVAIRQALDFSTARAVFTGALAGLAYGWLAVVF